MENSLKIRNYLVDNLKVILIFLVVFGHTIEYYIGQSEILRGIYMYIYMFHMMEFIWTCLHIFIFFERN
jgi:fucose 4-O-acetylase-like acetyltransferase